jgi:hypothetical protein
MAPSQLLPTGLVTRLIFRLDCPERLLTSECPKTAKISRFQSWTFPQVVKMLFTRTPKSADSQWPKAWSGRARLDSVSFSWFVSNPFTNTAYSTDNVYETSAAVLTPRVPATHMRINLCISFYKTHTYCLTKMGTAVPTLISRNQIFTRVYLCVWCDYHNKHRLFP